MLAYHMQIKLHITLAFFLFDTVQITLAENYKWYSTLLPIALYKKNRKKKKKTIQGYIIKQTHINKVIEYASKHNISVWSAVWMGLRL